MADSNERQFQTDILKSLERDGWLVGSAAHYDRANAVYTEDLLGFVKDAYPDRWKRFCKSNPGDPDKMLVHAAVKAIARDGTLHVLRHGFKAIGGNIKICAFRPDHGMNPDTERRYQANRLRVVEELSYSPDAQKDGYNPRIDLVLFVNGIPTATMELKSEFKQTVEHAKRQYKFDRPVKAPVTRRTEPLLTFKRGALVHFAVSQDEVAMTTKLDGKDTTFLPFNMGTAEGGAGNPQAASENSYATSYLWERLFNKDAWLKVIGRFMHLEAEKKETFEGHIKKKEQLIFPRYHQWDAVNQLIETTRREGPGHKYLIQHSAGSGKSNSIAWTAHQLSSLYADDGSKLFNSIVVVTDRTVLDSQLQNTIRQFEHAEGVVRAITRDVGNKSKSEQLAEALQEQVRIIVVTIQTFPALYDAIDKYPALQSGKYAIIADEAHSSQTGSSASKLKALLGSDHPEGEDVSAEELLDAAVQARMPNERISYYAFTATPKGKTLELFGRPDDPYSPVGDDNKPKPFHVYSMRQAIEEGFILDVLQNYTTYDTAWRIAHPEGEDKEVDSKKARIKLAKWVRLHPYNINQRVEIIVEHFRENVRHLLHGQAKAMVVTASRQEAVRYQLAMTHYIAEKGYQDVHALVAFSGEVPADDYIPQTVTEYDKKLNPGLNGRKHDEALDSDDFNVMIVANKYQTGFDQPKLCAMYVDKKLQGVECVQTLSRLNRTFPGKEQTFILDFFNSEADILEAFKPYYATAELDAVTDPHILFDIMSKLDAEHIYEWSEVRQFAEAFYDRNSDGSKLAYYCKPAKERFKARYDHAVETLKHARDMLNQARASGDKVSINKAEDSVKAAGEMVDQLELFKKNLNSYVRMYEFLSQITPYNDHELESLCVFAKNLLPLLSIERLDDTDDVDLSGLTLTHYRMTKQAEKELKLDDEEGGAVSSVKAVGTGKPHDPERKKLQEIIEALNELFGGDAGDEHQLHYAEGIAGRLRQDDDVMAQATKYSEHEVMHGLLPDRLMDCVVDEMADHEKLSMAVLENPAIRDGFARVILKMLVENHGTR